MRDADGLPGEDVAEIDLLALETNPAAVVTQPWAAELTALRARIDVAEFVERRIVTMTPAERRQFDALMKGNGPPKR